MIIHDLLPIQYYCSGQPVLILTMHGIIIFYSFYFTTKIINIKKNILKRTHSCSSFNALANLANFL